jgi:hypothetical protein
MPPAAFDGDAGPVSADAVLILFWYYVTGRMVYRRETETVPAAALNFFAL